MREISLHLIDIVQNSISAESSFIEISIIEDKVNDTITVQVIDNGKGMDSESIKKVKDPFFYKSKNT